MCEITMAQRHEVAGIPTGCSVFFDPIRWCRFAQPPANGLDASSIGVETQGTDTRNGYTVGTMGTGGGQTLFAFFAPEPPRARS